MAAASSPPVPTPQHDAPPPAALDVEITVVSGKHLKNVNWRYGPLLPYATLYLSPNHRFSTLPDDSNSTRPVWNERFLFPYSSFSSPDSIFAIDVFHSETPKPLVGSLRLPSASLLPDSPSSTSIVHSLGLLRPSGRPQGKLRLKVSLRAHVFVSPPRCYPPADYYPPPPVAHAFARPLPRAPPFPADADPPPPPPPAPLWTYYRHYGSNSNLDPVYRPSAPVDFTYPAQEFSDFRYARWSSNLGRNDQNSAGSECDEWVSPSAPTNISAYGNWRGSEEVSVSGGLAGLRLEEGSRARRHSSQD